MKIGSTVFLVALALLCTACSDGLDQPRQIARRFLEHISRDQFQEASAYLIPSQRPLLTILAQAQQTSDQNSNRFKTTQIHIDSVLFEHNDLVRLRFRFNRGEIAQLFLHRHGTSWLVQYPPLIPLQTE